MQVLVLTNTTDSIEAKLTAPVATNQPIAIVHYADTTSTSLTEASSSALLNNTTPVTIVGSPAASTRRVVKEITVYNNDTADVELTLQYNFNSVIRIFRKVTISVGDSYILSEDKGASLFGVVPIASGGTGQTTQQNAINALTNVSAATNGHVLTKDAGTGNAIFTASPGTGLTFIEQKTFGATATTTTFSSLTGSNAYMLISEAVEGSGSNTQLRIRINGDGDSTDYVQQQYSAVSTTVVASTLSDNSDLFRILANQESIGVAIIQLVSGRLIARNINGNYIGADSIEIRDRAVAKNSTVGSISSISIIASNANGIGIGTVFTLYELTI